MNKHENWPRCSQVDICPLRLKRKISSLVFLHVRIDFEFIQQAGIKYQAEDALSHLSTSGEGKRPLKHGLPTLAIAHFVIESTSGKTGNGSKHCIANMNTITATAEKWMHYPPSLVELANAQKHNVFWQHTIAQVGPANSDNIINPDGLFLQKSNLDYANTDHSQTIAPTTEFHVVAPSTNSWTQLLTTHLQQSF